MILTNLLKSRLALYQYLTRIGLILKATITGKVFACRALQGESGYNICINSDLSVSCNCQDYDNSGHIGDLASQTWTEVFHGETAQSFRNALSRRRFPVSVCWKCSDFSLIDKSEIDTYLTGYRLPFKGIMVENTVLCNLSCVGCDRSSLMRNRVHKSLPPGGIEIISDLIAANEIKNISFFNLGEPFLSANVCHEIRALRSKNMKARIITSTNGMLLDSPDKIDGALLLDHIYFSIDGSSQEALTKYQVGGDFQKSYNNMKNIVRVRDERGAAVPVIEWKYVLFRWNDRPSDIERAIKLARAAKVDIISFWPGGATLSYRSFRFMFHPFYRKLGKKSWKGREIDFRQGTA